MSFVVGGAEHSYLYHGIAVETAFETLRLQNKGPVSGQTAVAVIGPLLASLNPTTFTKLSGTQTITANGGSFNSKSVISMDGVVCPTTVVNATRLRFQTPVSAPAHVYNVTVKNGTGGTSAGLSLTSA